MGSLRRVERPRRAQKSPCLSLSGLKQGEKSGVTPSVYFRLSTEPDCMALIFWRIRSLGQSHYRSCSRAETVSSEKRLRIGRAGTPPTMV